MSAEGEGMSNRPKLYYHDHLGVIRGGEPADGLMDISPDTVTKMQEEIAALKAELARAREALIKQWEIVYTRSYSQDPIGRAEARYKREIAHQGEEG
jgi:hypothetical protein